SFARVARDALWTARLLPARGAWTLARSLSKIAARTEARLHLLSPSSRRSVRKPRTRLETAPRNNKSKKRNRRRALNAIEHGSPLRAQGNGGGRAVSRPRRADECPVRRRGSDVAQRA